ncbi:MAG: 16S rRNA (guanine(966)-N(2))-methyltransferase RsmD [Myxococcales bacterium]|nr:16S rRNA (guanine(966)-N(2))-methyltransferase RsmD [Myxococcales bacterium]
MGVLGEGLGWIKREQAGSVRITGGELRGQKIAVPKGDVVRPTSDRVREALFNILGTSVVGARVLDLFAGSGALGIETLSRGATSVCFVEQNRMVATSLCGNIERLGLTTRAKVMTADVLSTLSMLPKDNYDLVLMDPPYGKGYVPKVLSLVDSLKLVADRATVVCEVGEKDSVVPQDIGGLLFAERRVYGETALVFYDWVVPKQDGL